MKRLSKWYCFTCIEQCYLNEPGWIIPSVDPKKVLHCFINKDQEHRISLWLKKPQIVSTRDNHYCHTVNATLRKTALAFVNCISSFKLDLDWKIQMQTQLIKKWRCLHRVQFLCNESAKTFLWHLQGSILQEEHKETIYHSRETWIFNTLSNQEGLIYHSTYFSTLKFCKARNLFNLETGWLWNRKK